MERKAFNHPDLTTEQLRARAAELDGHLDAEYLTEERKAEIMHELSCIALERWWRREQLKKEEAEKSD